VIGTRRSDVESVIALPNRAFHWIKRQLRGAGSVAPRAVPSHGEQLIRTACMARKLGAAAGLLRRIRLCLSGPRVQLTLRVSVHDRHSPTLGPGQRLDRWLQRQAAALRAGLDVPGRLWAGHL